MKNKRETVYHKKGKIWVFEFEMKVQKDIKKEDILEK